MNKRHQVLLFLIVLAIITFLDRISIASAGPRIQEELHIPAERWGWILGVFILAYGLFEVPTGAMGDRSGHGGVLTRIVLWWSAFTSLTGAATGFFPMLAIRFLFGAGEAGAYPNMSGVLGRWFRADERARTQGFIWAASRLGGAIAPLVVVPLQMAIGWRQTFVVFGIVGALWAAAWHFWYHDLPASQPGVPALAPTHAGVPWGRLVRQRQLWLIVVMYFCYAFGSWFYFGWFPTWLVKGAGFTEAQMGIFAALPFLAGAAGNLAGGYLSDRLVRALGLKTARRLVGCASLLGSSALLVCMTLTRDQTAIVILSSLAFGIADLMLPTAWALCLDIGSSHAGVVTGVMNTAGQLGGFVCSVVFGYVVKATGSYNAPLWGVAFMVMVAALLFTQIDATRPLLEPTAAS